MAAAGGGLKPAVNAPSLGYERAAHIGSAPRLAEGGSPPPVTAGVAL
jgi:hypothetical protein